MSATHYTLGPGELYLEEIIGSPRRFGANRERGGKRIKPPGLLGWQP
jgi:hypothetical protein